MTFLELIKDIRAERDYKRRMRQAAKDYRSTRSNPDADLRRAMADESTDVDRGNHR